ncbi:MAG: hypothetical protein HXS44_12675 [Theionarchaea archaeon]|nr:hypothetical protein [Theionarchaea archaeon]
MKIHPRGDIAMLIYMILVGYLFLVTFFLNRGIKQAGIINASLVKTFEIALVSTGILLILIFATIGILFGYTLAYLAILPVVKEVYKITWGTAFRVLRTGFFVVLLVNAVGFFLVLTIL